MKKPLLAGYQDVKSHICFVFSALLLLASGSVFSFPDSGELDDLRYMREEEKLARDLYSRFYTMWGDGLFATIANSEQRHTDAVLNLLTSYGSEDPAAGQSAGVFTVPALQQLYNQLLARGSLSLVTALEAAITVELTDIDDLVQAVAQTDEAAIRRVYNNLLNGSRNHLASFSNRLEALGGNPAAGNTLDPGVSIYEPISRLLYIPALDVTNAQGVVTVYDALLKMVEALPQTLELLSANVTDKVPSQVHAAYERGTGIVTVPKLQVGALAVDSVANNSYFLELQYLSASSPQLFSVRTLTVLP